jgi:hypothetical protein
MTVQTNTADKIRSSLNTDLLHLRCNAEAPLLDAVKFMVAAIVFASVILTLTAAIGNGLA